MRKIICVLISVYLLCTSIPVKGNASVYSEVEQKRVLFISSYTEYFLSVPDQISGVRSVLEEYNIEVDTEFMDTKRFDTEESELLFYNLLKYKLDLLDPYTAIIVGDDNALQFALDYQDDIFVGIPIFFLGVNDMERATKASENKYITGVIEEHFIEDNIELGLRLNKSAKNIVAIVDSTLTGIGDRNQFYDFEDNYKELNFFHIDSQEYTFEEVKKLLQTYDKDSIILYLSMYRDKTGANITINEAVDIISENTHVPVYRAVVGGVGRGIIGGKTVSYLESGRIIANMILDYINGKPIETIEMVAESPYSYMFDYNILEKYNISEELLPEDAIIINRKLTFYEQNKELVRNTVIVIVTLVVFVVILVIDNLKRRKAENALRESHEELSHIYEELLASEEELKAQYSTIENHMCDIEALNEQLEHMAKHDYLTGLPNRRGFTDRLNYELEQGNPGAVLLLDVDNFKVINDTIGHSYGDQMLKEIANKFSRMSNENIMVSRFGGDEFLVLICNEKSAEKVESLTKNILKDFQKAIFLNGEETFVNFSIGITRYPYDGDTVDHIITNADTAMYKVKNLGKNGYRFYSSEMLTELKEKSDIEIILRKSIKNDGLMLLYQPQVNVSTGHIVGFEALLRIKDHNISPAKFIPIAEETGLIVDIGRWVVKEAIQQLQRWKQSGYELKPIAINFSSKQLRDRYFLNYLNNTLHSHDMEPKYLEIEITESFLLEKTDLSTAFLSRLKELGVNLALDDFGTGYSSLNYLTFLPVNKIKLDKSLCEKFLSHENVKVMDSLISLAHSLSLEITAEGIEEIDQYKRLRTGGCDYIQGYLFSKPLKIEEINELYHVNLLERLKEK